MLQNYQKTIILDIYKYEIHMFLKDISTIVQNILAEEKNLTVQQLYEKCSHK